MQVLKYVKIQHFRCLKHVDIFAFTCPRQTIFWLFELWATQSILTQKPGQLMWHAGPVSVTTAAGTLPAQYSAWNPLFFSVRGNLLVGSLPSSWGMNWTQTTWLDLGNNSLTGARCDNRLLLHKLLQGVYQSIGTMLGRCHEYLAFWLSDA